MSEGELKNKVDASCDAKESNGAIVLRLLRDAISANDLTLVNLDKLDYEINGTTMKAGEIQDKTKEPVGIFEEIIGLCRVALKRSIEIETITKDCLNSLQR